MHFPFSLRHIDSELPVPPQFETMEQMVDESLAQRRFQMSLILLFSVAALVLASLGIYGVVSYSVASRTNELGIRMALGARDADVLQMILPVPVALGLGGSLVVSLGLGRLPGALLYGVNPIDAVTIISVVLTLYTVAALVRFIPARRTTRIDPVSALRYEWGRGGAPDGVKGFLSAMGLACYDADRLHDLCGNKDANDGTIVRTTC